MASLDLQEQEQLDNLRAFWAKWGGLLNTLLILGLGAFAAWNGWQWYLRDQGVKASTVYDTVEVALEAKDLAKASALWQQMKVEYPRATYTAHAGMLLAQAQAAGVKTDDAVNTLEWVATKSHVESLRDLAHLRLAAVHLEAKQYQQAEAALAAVKSSAFAALVADRRGDLAQLQNQPDKAREFYKAAYTSMDDKQQYRTLVEAKLMALGVDTGALAKVEVK